MYSTLIEVHGEKLRKEYSTFEEAFAGLRKDTEIHAPVRGAYLYRWRNPQDSWSGIMILSLRTIG